MATGGTGNANGFCGTKSKSIDKFADNTNKTCNTLKTGPKQGMNVSKKQEKLAKGIMVRRQSDYPTMNDVLSTSETDKDDK